MAARNFYPRPQFVRENWQNLNGSWQFCFDDDNCGLTQRWYLDTHLFDSQIQVPFVYQSRLSGIFDTTCHDTVWYKRRFQAEKRKGYRMLLHFGAVDYHAMVFLNGHLLGEHEGGHTPFTFDITDAIIDGDEQTLAVRVYDPQSDEMIPRGKQSWEEKPKGIWYTGSTGIWQTVWLECVEERHFSDIRFTSLYDDGKESICCTTAGDCTGCLVEYEIRFQEDLVGAGTVACCHPVISWDVDLIQQHIFRTNFHDDGWSWTPEHPNLFTAVLTLRTAEGHVTDQVSSYFGFRKVHQENGMVYLNNKPYYERLVLDQGYWPNGLMSAPTDEDYKKDIELAKQMGFNGCRKHQKMEDPVFLYWADQLGFLVWGECASAPMYGPDAAKRLMQEWSEILERDYSHPCIVVWVPLNESWGIPNIHFDAIQQHFSQAMYHYLHALDHTRLVVSNDGWEMTETDICAIHNYAHGQKEETAKFAAYKQMLSTRENLVGRPSADWDIYARGFAYRGEPIVLTEFGGIGFELCGEGAWGYTAVDNEEDFLEDYRRIMEAVYMSEGLCGFCYTQLTDVEQEMNGLLTYDRKPKCSLEKIQEINLQYHKKILPQKVSER